jgi:2-oxoisovalerate dehydrogenase E1 component alpha subunit
MPETVTRILDENGKLVSGRDRPNLERDQLLFLYKTMLFNRLVDDRMTKLQRQGRIGFYVGSRGEEAAIVGSAYALAPQDWIVPCYREAGAAFIRGYPFYKFVCQIFGNQDDPMKGRQMPCHWGDPDLRLTSVSSPVGSQIPHATGLAMAAQYQGKDEVALVYFGDGATSQGDFHVACNFAGVYKSPVIFFCRNNQWAISIPFKNQTASEDIAIKAKAYGIRGIKIDGNDVLEVYQATLDAAERARKGHGPTLIEALTYRQGAHTTSDDPRAYRDDSEVKAWIKKDPILRFNKFLIGEGLWSEDQDQVLADEIDTEIRETIKQVETLAPPGIESIFEDVYDTMPRHLREQMVELINTKEQV